MLKPSSKATVLYLIAQWPKYVPLTRKAVLDFLYLIDNEQGKQCLELPWDTSQGFLNCPELLKALEEWGCLHHLKKSLVGANLTPIMDNMEEKQKVAADTLLAEMRQCKKVIDSEKIKIRAKILWMGQ